MGGPFWTENGEAFGLRLDKPLEAGKTHSFDFTYAADGYNSEGPFKPILKTCNIANLFFATPVDTLPPTSSQWTTSISTFTATAQQSGHTWLIIHNTGYSGTILSNCKSKSPIKKLLLPKDTVLCSDDKFELHAQTGKNFEYLWSTGSTD